METTTVVLTVVKWLLIGVTILVNGTLAWKILRKKSLQTIFNLGMCFYFIFTGSFFPIMVYQYGGLLNDMMVHPDAPSPERCQIFYICRIVTLQVMKVFLLNLMFRYIIIKFSHYSLGLSNSFSGRGTNHWILRVSYFAILLSFIIAGSVNHIVKSYKEEMMEHIVKGRICLLLRFLARNNAF